MFVEGLFNLGGDVRRMDNSLVRGLGGVIAFDGFGSDWLFGEEFGGREEEVVEGPPF